MNVLIVSQCSKRALTETRRILDLFAERRGDRTWQTPITQQGLDTLRRLLRKTARKNTAVAAHWIRGRDHSELLWIVGDAGQFNAQGATPTNMTTRNVLRKDDENDWHTAEPIRLLAAMAALFHDFGKANELFQAKLKPGHKDGMLADPYRHEWVSLRLFEAFVGDHQGNDADWLNRLTAIVEKPDIKWVASVFRDGLMPLKTSAQTYPLNHLPPLAQAIGWLIVTHHRLPTPTGEIKAKNLPHLLGMIDATWCGARDDETVRVKKVWQFTHPLPHTSKAWCQRAQKIAQRIQACSALQTPGKVIDDAYVMHLARLCLILGDHHYSSQPPKDGTLGDPDFKSYANTHSDGTLKQKLDDHLIGVEKTATGIAHALTKAERVWPRLARHRGFKRRSSDTRFAWQDKAFDLVTALQPKAAQHGFFGVNMASTGGGKTLANARIAYALADPERGTRFCVALGLRTLTLQTGQAYRERLGLTEEDLAVMVGGTATRQLFAYQQSSEQSNADAKSPSPGSESSQELLPDNTHVHFNGALTSGPLTEWLTAGKQGGSASNSAHKLLQAPVLVCTIDHLMPATESTRGGSHIAPMLRLMSSDLILDEPDDFDLADLPALSRLVHWAGLLGSRVLLSSATLAPAIVHGLFAAYAAGRAVYQANRGQPGLTLDVCCAWFDEFNCQASSHPDEATFSQAHQQFTHKRAERLGKKEVRRRARVLPLTIGLSSQKEGATPKEQAHIRNALAAAIHSELFALHQAHHTRHATSKQRVSFGLVRMANVDPLIDVAQALLRLPARPDHRVHLCVYHSRHPLLMRSAIEARLDRVLKRHQPEEVFKDDEIRQLLAAHPEQNHLFVVLASPVAEVGRDHDYDWAIVEPSSMRSIIQLAGRVRRHREGAVEEPNIVLLDTNCRALESPGKAAFKWPGFESDEDMLTSHQLSQLLRPEEFNIVDARSRIVPPQPLSPKARLVDLEHHRLLALMGDTPNAAYNLRRWWQTPTALSAIEQRAKPFRHDPIGHEDFVLIPNADSEGWTYMRLELDGDRTSQQNRIGELSLQPPAQGMQWWGADDYMAELVILAEYFSLSLDDCALRFGTVQLAGKEGTQQWIYHPSLGFRRTK